MLDAIVVGGGPAGAACALWAHQMGLRVLLLEAGPALGGLQRRSPYENRWLPGKPGRTGQQVAADLQAHLEQARVPFRLAWPVTGCRPLPGSSGWQVLGGDGEASEPVDGSGVSERGVKTCPSQAQSAAVARATASICNAARARFGVTSGHVGSVHRFSARCLVLATGSRPRSGGFRESDRVGIGPGLSMERLEVAGRRVAILGGGDNAFDQAFFALGRGAREVDVYCRRPPHAQALLQARIDPARVHVGPFQAEQDRMMVDGRAVDVLGVQFGFEAVVPPGLSLPMRGGYVEVDRAGEVPGLPGLFAAGEMTNYWHPCVATACAHGIQVAKSVQARVAATAPGA